MPTPPKARQTLTIRAPWPGGGQIPSRYTCDGQGTAPAIRGGGPRSALVMTDPDAPGGTFVHWTRWDAGVEGRNSFGRVGYGPPCPPKGDKTHRYVVTVYSLRQKLGLPRGAAVAEVLAAIRRAARASGTIIGTYRR